jgi:serine/threonine protein kinase
MKIKGGKVIASGGYGCVFSPALKCNNKKRKKGMISKLMIKKYALEEYNEINKIKEKLDNIPNYLDFFLIGNFSICHPEKLSSKDLQNFDKCTALPKKNITKKNINKSLDKVVSLNIPFGGYPVDDYMYENISYEKISQLNDSLIELLTNGIIPMNERNVYHSDIKDSNILVEYTEKKMYTRLIDWGLSTEYAPHKGDKFPRVWENRPFQFNAPFSNILFSETFIEKYTNYLKEETNLKTFVINYIVFWMKERGNGHYKYINNIMYMLFSRDLSEKEEKNRVKIIESEYTMMYITNYIVKVLEHFTNFKENGQLDLRIYLDNVYVKILDIWGFITNYIPLLEILYENYDNLSERDLELFKHLKRIFIEYLYNPRIEAISIPQLTEDLKKINIYLKTSFDKRHSNTIRSIAVNTTRNITKIRSMIKNKTKKRNQHLLFLSKKK